MPDNLGTQLSHTTPSSVLQFFSSASHSLVSILPAPQIYSSSTHLGFTCQSTSCLSFLSLIIRLVIDSLSPPLTLLPFPFSKHMAEATTLLKPRSGIQYYMSTASEAGRLVAHRRGGNGVCHKEQAWRNHVSSYLVLVWSSGRKSRCNQHIYNTWQCSITRIYHTVQGALPMVWCHCQPVCALLRHELIC